MSKPGMLPAVYTRTGAALSAGCDNLLQKMCDCVLDRMGPLWNLAHAVWPRVRLQASLG